MTMRTARILQMLAVILFAFALLAAVLYIPLQDVWKSFYVLDESSIVRTVPAADIVRQGIFLFLAVCYFLLLGTKARGPLKVPIVIIAVLYALLSVVIFPLVSQLAVRIAGAVGTAQVVSLSVQSSYMGFTAAPLTAVAGMLMLFSMGGAYGKTEDAQTAAV